VAEADDNSQDEVGLLCTGRRGLAQEPNCTPYSSLEVVELDLEQRLIVSDHQGVRQTS